MKKDIKLPEIRIIYGWLLERESKIIAESIKWPMLTSDEATDKVGAYRLEWGKYSRDLLNYACATLGFGFYKDVIDVHIAQYFMPKSEPLIISLMDEPDQFVDTLMHELLHVLLTDNENLQMNGKHRGYNLEKQWRELFGNEHTFTTLVHIPVHAVHKKIYLEYFKDSSRLDREVALLKRFKSVDYLKSWDYVDKEGHEKIIDNLKDSYKKILNVAGASK